MSFLNSLLLTLIKALHTLINNYALTIIVFTILIKLVVMPLNLKSRRSTMRMTTIQPKAAALQEKYKDDQEKLNQKLQELYRKEGINPMGAMMYERHKDKIRKDASWWCQAETVVGCINAWQLTGEQSYLDSAVRTWNFIKSRMIDKEYGEWFRTVLEDGTPRYKEPKASMWNCPYHNSRMGFEIDTRLK